MAACSLAISSFFSLPGDCRVPSFGFVENLVGRVAAEAGERADQELPQRAGIAFARAVRSSASSDTLLRGRRAAVGQRHFDQKRIAAIDGRRPRGGGVELARHDLVQALEQQLLADRRDAIGRRRRRSSSSESPDTARRLRAGRCVAALARVLSLAVSQILRATPGLTREKLSRQELRDRRRLACPSAS